MKTFHSLLLGGLGIVISLAPTSCVVTEPVGGSVAVGYYDTLPGDYYGPYYYAGNRYYYGGRWETGRFLYQGHYHTGRYYHNGHYYYGGRYNAGRSHGHHDHDHDHDHH
jgi:hypothetical protein